MEFEDVDREEEEEEDDYDDDDDEDEGITIPPPSTQIQTQTTYNTATPPPYISNTNHLKLSTTTGGQTTSIRYRECLKNHAVNIGAHAVDGCGEFMPAGEDGTLAALKCAACGCHRNFHRKESSSLSSSEFHNSSPASNNPHPQPIYPQFTPYYRTPPFPLAPHPHHHPIYPRPLALPSTSGGYGTLGDQEMEELSNPSSSGGGGRKSKRFRTKFTQEQKDKMLEFAERVGWRIQKHDESAVQQFCEEVGVRRQVLKVWMHNNKNSLGTGKPPADITMS